MCPDSREKFVNVYTLFPVIFIFNISYFFPHSSYPPYDEKLPDRKKNPKIYLISHFFFSPLLLYV